MSEAAEDSGNYTKEALGKSAANKGAYFAGLQTKNEARSADLPPSQGGKYAGFGSGSNTGGAGAAGDAPKKKSRFGSMLRSRGKGRTMAACVLTRVRVCKMPVLLLSTFHTAGVMSFNPPTVWVRSYMRLPTLQPTPVRVEFGAMGIAAQHTRGH